MSEITREEVEFRFASTNKDVDNLGTNMRDHKKETREDFQSVWRAIDGMLIKVGIVVTIATSCVMLIFKVIESTGHK